MVSTKQSSSAELEIKLLEDKYSLSLYQKRNLVITRAKGSILWDINGKEYIDCAVGIGVANIGHCNDDVVKAIQKQAETILTCPGIFYNDIRAKFLETLVKITPNNLNKVFLCNSGAETIEAAIKFARATTGKTDFICFNRSFHGRTFGALSATFNKKYKEKFQPLVKEFFHVPLNNIEKFYDVFSEDIAGVILELVQGEGGINVAEKKFVKRIKSFCEEKNIIFIIDEVQTGIGRTGTLFASQLYDVEPDILCLAKALGGGVPIGAVICSENIDIGLNQHGSTFGGNPLACAAGLATLNFVLSNNLPKLAEEKGNYIKKRLLEAKMPIIRDIRGLGLMIGIELKTRVKNYVDALLNEGIVVLVSGTTVIRLLPALTISYSEIDTVIEKIIKVLTSNN
ncbi:MAG: Acetylornithine/acetyl-lysine aminotransferase [Candidatus Heimdallarchaeota archaeon LC_3]|nr:MAG: Acetylornithine/acetyl-lysine aminotransferase [Candidatus Heimdallarchaeota archaeon LC_3]